MAKQTQIDSGNYTGPERRINGNGNGNGNGWTSLSAWGRFIGYVGVPAAIAGFLVYILGTNVPQIVLQQTVIIKQQETLAKQNDELKAMMGQLIRIAQWHCYLVARTDDGRRDCYNK